MKNFNIIFICIFCMAFVYSITALSQNDYDNEIKTGVFDWMSNNNMDTIPVIIFNEREITLEEFASIPPSSIGTYQGYLPPLSVNILGERGKRGILYVNTKKNHIPLFPSQGKSTENYYYHDGDRPAEFPGGDLALKSYLHNAIKVRPELDSISATVYVKCYFDEEGDYEKGEVTHITFLAPQPVEVFYDAGRRPKYDIITEKYTSYLDMLREDALAVANDFPKFEPATFWLQHVKYTRVIRMYFNGKNAQLSEGKY